MLILTEKPSVAQAFADALGGFQKSKENGWLYRGDADCIVAAHGHLLELFMPEDYNSELKKWTLDTLPIIPNQMRYKPIPDPKMNSLKIIGQALKTFGHDNFILATDAEREGELIGYLILEHLGFTGWNTARRFWVSEALTPEVVKKGLAAAKPLLQYKTYRDAGLARSQADWLVGMNFSRLLSISTGTLLSFGRVQTAVLGAIYARDMGIKNFKPVPYQQFSVTVAKDGHTFTMLLDHDGQNRFPPHSPMLARAADVFSAQSVAILKSVSRQQKSLQPPQLLNITGLQKICSQKYSLSPAETLDLAQSLYEKHRCLSYPRTPSTVLGDENVDLFKNKYELLSPIYPELSAGCLPESISQSNKRIFNSAKLKDHHALIPLAPLPETASKKEALVYTVVLERFFTAIKKPHLYEAVSITASKDSFQLKAVGKIVLDAGWKKNGDNDDENQEQTLPSLQEGDKISITKAEILDKQTQPKKHFTEASILALMENPRNEEETSGKLVGLGTPATRAEILEKLLKREYIVQDKKNLLIGDKGIFLMQTILQLPELAQLVTIQTTTAWEEQLESAPELFLELMKNMLTTKLPSMKVEKKWEKPSLGTCPLCKNGKIMAGEKNWYCSRYKDGCSFTLWKNVSGAKLSDTDLQQLLEGKTTRPKKMKSKAGKEFSARLKLIQNGKVDFIFDKKK